MRKAVTVATRVLGAEDRLTIKLGGSLGQHLYWDPDASLGQLRESPLQFWKATAQCRNASSEARIQLRTFPRGTSHEPVYGSGKPKRAEAREGGPRRRRNSALKICKTVVS